MSRTTFSSRSSSRTAFQAQKIGAAIVAWNTHCASPADNCVVGHNRLMTMTASAPTRNDAAIGGLSFGTRRMYASAISALET